MMYIGVPLIGGLVTWRFATCENLKFIRLDMDLQVPISSSQRKDKTNYLNPSPTGVTSLFSVYFEGSGSTPLPADKPKSRVLDS